MAQPPRSKKSAKPLRCRLPSLCETCGNALRWEPGIREWGVEGYWVCDHGCFACAFCARVFRKDRYCVDCQAALARPNGPRFCGCGAPMVAKGMQMILICKDGCALCPGCDSPVPFGGSCKVCQPRPLQAPPEFDDDLPI